MDQGNANGGNSTFSAGTKNKTIMMIVIFLMLIIIGQLWYIVSLKKNDPAPPVQQVIRQDRRESRVARGDHLRQWDPFQEMNRMQQRINSLFNDSFFRGGYGLTASPRSSFFYEPDIDIQETDDEYIIKVDMPGMEKENISVTVQNDHLTIEGERKAEREERSDDDRFFRIERNFGSFQRTIPLPGEVDDTGLAADYEKGVLTITLPKVAPQMNDQPEGTKVTVN